MDEDGEIPLDAVLRANRVAPPVLIKFVEAAVLTAEQIQQLSKQLEADIQQAFIKLMEQGGKVDYTPEGGETVRKLVEAAYARLVTAHPEYGAVRVNITVEE